MGLYRSKCLIANNGIISLTKTKLAEISDLTIPIYWDILKRKTGRV